MIDNPAPGRMPDRMAGSAFALAADPSLLAAHSSASPAATVSRRYRPKALPNSCSILAGHGFVGANVTIPHKERALALTEPDERARAVGAANTLWYEGGELRSTNTDVEGFIRNLDASAPGMGR